MSGWNWLAALVVSVPNFPTFLWKASGALTAQCRVWVECWVPLRHNQAISKPVLSEHGICISSVTLHPLSSLLLMQTREFGQTQYYFSRPSATFKWLNLNAQTGVGTECNVLVSEVFFLLRLGVLESFHELGWQSMASCESSRVSPFVFPPVELWMSVLVWKLNCLEIYPGLDFQRCWSSSRTIFALLIILQWKYNYKFPLVNQDLYQTPGFQWLVGTTCALYWCDDVHCFWHCV